MPITQKRIYEVTIPEKLNRLLGLPDHSVNTLRDLRAELLAFGNEITESLGIFVAPQKEAKASKTKKTNRELTNKIMTRFNENSKKAYTAKEMSSAINTPFSITSTTMGQLAIGKVLIRHQNPASKFREYVYELPPSTISIESSSG